LQKDAPYFATKTEMVSEELDDNSMQVGAVPHHEAKKEIVSLSSGNDNEFSSEIPSCSARGGMTGGSLSKWKRKGMYIIFHMLFEHFNLTCKNRFLMWSMILILYAT
jgi:hypothetical protein